MFVRMTARWLLIVGVGLLAVGCHKKGTAARPSLAEARELPRPLQEQFVRLGLELRTLKCVRVLDWSHPTAECVNQVVGCETRVYGVLTDEMVNLPEDKYPHMKEYAKLAAFMREDLQVMQMVFAVPLAYRPNNVETRLTRAAQKAAGLADVLDEIFALDDPEWGIDRNADDDKPARVAAPPPPKPAAPAPKAAEPAAAESEVAAVATDAGTPADADGGVAVVRPPEKAQVTSVTVVSGLRELLQKLDTAGHESGRITDLTLNMPHYLERIDADIHTYRSGDRGPNDTESANRFADQAAKARNKMSKTVGALSAANRKLLNAVVEPGDSPFVEADGFLEEARTEVVLTEDFSRKAP